MNEADQQRLSEIEAKHSIVLGECVGDHATMLSAAKCDDLWLVERLREALTRVSGFESFYANNDLRAERDQLKERLREALELSDLLTLQSDTVASERDLYRVLARQSKAERDQYKQGAEMLVRTNHFDSNKRFKVLEAERDQLREQLQQLQTNKDIAVSMVRSHESFYKELEAERDLYRDIVQDLAEYDGRKCPLCRQNDHADDCATCKGHTAYCPVLRARKAIEVNADA